MLCYVPQQEDTVVFVRARNCAMRVCRQNRCTEQRLKPAELGDMETRHVPPSTPLFPAQSISYGFVACCLIPSLTRFKTLFGSLENPLSLACVKKGVLIGSFRCVMISNGAALKFFRSKKVCR
jgi:hypothetical protein